MKNIIIQGIIGFFVISLVFAAMVALFDTYNKDKNYSLLLDKREWSCVESKTEMYTTTVMAGKVPITQRHNREVCITMKRN